MRLANNMDGALKWIMTIYAWLVFLHCFNITSINAQHVGSKISNNNNNPGFISIDCGADNDYLDEQTGIWYQRDTYFVETGMNHNTSPNVDLNYLYFRKQLNTLRNFPDGKRNCYALKHEQSKNYNYLIRAFFAYGNYDGQNRTSVFDLYLGVNYWDTVGRNIGYQYTKIIQAPSTGTDTIHVCLVNTGQGIPYISALELWPVSSLSSSLTYPVSSLTYPLLSNSESLLYLPERFDVGASRRPLESRYNDDIYGRIWRSFDQNDWYSFNKSVTFDPTTTNDAYKLPVEVWRTAATTINVSDALEFDSNLWRDEQDKSSKYYVIFHFLEIEQLPLGKKRIINITLNDESILSKPLVLDYLEPKTIGPINATQGRINFRIFATPESDVPPILNAFETLKVITQLSPTDATDVDAIMNIKSTYQISRLNWQGDPCIPYQFVWEGLNCSSDINPRITSLNISSSRLNGNIAPSISNLHLIECLDLSNNNLTGDVPGFLSQLRFLRVLNLQGNELSRAIPAELIEKSKNGSLTFNYSGNPALCSPNSCNKIDKNKAVIPPKKKNKAVIPLVASLTGASILVATITFWVYKRRRPAVNKLSHYSNFNKRLQSKEQQFTYAEVLRITNNFERVVGKGGFGIVYHGYLGNAQVAIKVLYPSAQGCLQFQGEAELLTIIHHKCLIALIGYCDEGMNLALIYEYMANGDLAEHLLGKSEHIISWKQRLQIAINAAEGLEYLHNSCKPPIVHRDVKSRNILLNEKFRAKLADFGLSKMFADEDDTHMYTIIAGTRGYIDPEYSRSNRLTEKSDVYSFGVVLLEIITGQPVISKTEERIHIVKWVESMLPSGDIDNIVDSRLQGEYNIDSARIALDIAMECVALASFNRPTMSLVVRELKQCLPIEMTLPSDLYQDPSYSSIDISFDRVSGESSLAR